jgi:SpoVK/Ycf46/Vps4 family AAA+-type ATPase
MDVGRVFGGLVGESEAKMRQAITTAEAVSPCILWIDELDKAFGGVRGYQGDAGAQLRVFGSFITWLQEKDKAVFVIATANNPQVLPAELLRKGRFDEIFFVDLPSGSERREIFAIHLQKRNRWPRDFDLDELATRTEGFSGAEIEQIIIEAMYEAFPDDERPFTTQDILDQIQGAPDRDIEPFVKLSDMMKEDIEQLRKWTEGRARRASRAEFGRATDQMSKGPVAFAEPDGWTRE